MNKKGVNVKWVTAMALKERKKKLFEKTFVLCVCVCSLVQVDDGDLGIFWDQSKNKKIKLTKV